MRAFQVLITETRQRRMQVAANTLAEARSAVQDLLSTGETIARVDQLGEARTGRAPEAIAHLLNQPYFTLAGVAATVADWLQAAVAGDDAQRRALNARMAMAGLRVIDGPSIVIGSAGSVPTLAQWFKGTEWQGPDLISTLRTATDAPLRVYSFSGVNSKSVVLPAALVLGGAA